MDKLHDDLREVMGLLPCPFCGEAPIIYDREHHPKRDCWTVICNNDGCPACLVYTDRDTEAEAITAWNTRHGPALLARQEGEDGERYRWLRDQANVAKRTAPQVCMVDCMRPHDFRMLTGDEVDAAIDAARSGGGG